MTPELLQQWVPLLNLVGAPLVVLYAIHRGWLATKRELDLLQTAYDRLLGKYDQLEKEMREDQMRLRQELDSTRDQLVVLLIDLQRAHNRVEAE